MVDGLLNEAMTAQTAGDLARARELYARVLSADPAQADALQMLGVIAQQSGDLVQARAFMQAGLASRPADARAQYNYAILCSQIGDAGAAITAYEAAVKAAPNFAEAHSNLGNAYAAAGRTNDALRAYADAIQAQPDFAAAYVNLAALLVALEHFDDAIHALETASAFAPSMPQIFANLAALYRRRGRLREALAPAARALELRGGDRDAYVRLSADAFGLGAYDIAADACGRALAFEPESAELHYNRAAVDYATGRFAQAIAGFQTALERDPGHVAAHVNLGLARLIGGDLAGGWDDYAWTWRLESRRASYPYLDRATIWNGEPFADRELLITREQGYGDAIQMARFLPAVKARGGRVVLEAAPALVALFADLPGVDELRAAPDTAVATDGVTLYVPLLGLPRALRVDLASIPAPVPYLRATADRIERWRPRLTASSNLRIGISWAGHPHHAADRARSLPLEAFSEFGDIDGIAWFGLQKGVDEARRSCGSFALDPLGPEIADFADTAAIVAQLDLVIAVDTAVVHLAGALGKPVWTLLPFVPDWRWMLDRSDSPWYPTMRLFRQRRAGEWAGVVREIAAELRQLRYESS